MKQITNVYVELFRRTYAVIDVDTNSLGIFIEQGRSLKKLKSCIRIKQLKIIKGGEKDGKG